MSFLGGTPPGHKAGDVNPTTTARRPKTGLTESQGALVRRRLRSDSAPSYAVIAADLGVPEEAVRLEAMRLRTRRSRPPRGTLNCTPEAVEFVKAIADTNGMPVWEIMDVVLREWSLLTARQMGR